MGFSSATHDISVRPILIKMLLEQEFVFEKYWSLSPTTEIAES
jgi:hypothetical protein